MGFKVVKDLDYKLEFIAGDTEFIRLTIKDVDKNVIDVSTNTEVKMGIKKKRIDNAFIIPEKIATTYVYHPDNQRYTIEFEYSSQETKDILNYDGKIRDTLWCYYDIELRDTSLGNEVITTVLSGKLLVTRSIRGEL
jgi:hypothetical protein